MSYPFENVQLDSNIKINYLFNIAKMEDVFLAVRFRYQKVVWNGAVPIRAKYQGVFIPYTREDVFDWVRTCYENLNPAQYQVWQNDQNRFWQDRKSEDTKLVFDALNGTEKTTRWLCRKCGPVPQVNPQPAARIRTLKMMGYYIATMQLECSSCGNKQYFDLLIRLPRHAADNQKRYTITKSLRSKILEILPNIDCVFETPLEEKACIIDHKFPSSRWVNGETVNHISMPADEIKNKFQILSNQTNLQKERYCQRCVLDGKRGDFFGIEWYYEGDRQWRGNSKADENGCVGCPWYDVKRWKAEFNKHLHDIQ